MPPTQILPPDPVYVMRGNMGCVHSLLFRVSPYVEHLYAGTESGLVHIWDMRKNRELLRLNICHEPCLGLQMIGNECLITQRKGGAINFWKPESSNWVMNETIETDYCGFCRCQMSTENSMLIPLNDSRVGLLSLKTLKTEIELNPHELPNIKSIDQVMVIKPCIDASQYVLVGYDGGLLALWDIRSKKILSSLNLEDCPMCLDFNSTLMSGAIGSPRNYVQLFSLGPNFELREKAKVNLKDDGTSAIAFRPDGNIFATARWDSRIAIYSCKFMRPLAVLDTHKATIHDIVYSSCKVEAYNSKCLMAAGGKDGYISLWDLYN